MVGVGDKNPKPPVPQWGLHPPHTPKLNLGAEQTQL